jgi:hypothetical protein
MTPFLGIQGHQNRGAVGECIQDRHLDEYWHTILKYLGIPNYYFKGKMH